MCCPNWQVLCAGDDVTDETMFRAASENDLSIKVGPGDTAARFRISSPTAFRRLLAEVLSELDDARGKRQFHLPFELGEYVTGDFFRRIRPAPYVPTMRPVY